MLEPSYYHHHAQGVLLYVRATPKARVEGAHGVVEDGHGKVRLKISVHAAPTDGSANQAILSFLAKALRLPSSALHLVRGDTQRDKTILLHAPLREMEESLKRLSNSHR